MKNKRIDGNTSVFRASSANTGVVTVQHDKHIITVHKNGKPVKAGDIKSGQIICTNTDTGEMEKP